MASFLDVLAGANPVSAVINATVGKVVDKALSYIPDPQARAEAEKELRALEVQEEAKELDDAVAQLQSVNATMQAEIANSKDEAWYQKAWRPFNGFVVGLGALFSVITCCALLYQGIFKGDAAAIQAVPGLAFAIATILSVPGAAVGITAWHRGMLQREQVQGGSSS